MLLTVLFSIGILGCSKQPLSTSSTPASPEGSSLPYTPPASDGGRDLVILSLEENGYAHLFSFDPARSKFTRLTYGTWNDITPSLSPDGKFIAFASDRSGHWDIFDLAVQTGKITQLTDSPQYDSSPTWSPDMAWIAYETYQNNCLDIALLSLNNPGQAPILLTDSLSTNHSPAWAPNGRKIAFVSNRSGNSDIWIADLNKTQDRFTDLTNTKLSAESHPTWSPDGSHLAWSSMSQNYGYNGIYVWDATKPDKAPVWVGDGDWPAWNSQGDTIITEVIASNQMFISAYSLQGQPILLPTPLPGKVHGLIWPKIDLQDPLIASLEQAAEQTPPALWEPLVTPVPGVPAQRWYVVPLQNVQAPYPQLHDLVNDSFVALRQRVIKETGWDALASLENAYVPLTTALDPGLGEDWLYTGRAFAINSLMINAGWMTVVREDIGAQTYWRVYLRTQNPDGTQGAPIEDPPWDINARYKLDPVTYEAGGQYASVPPGYWIDFTSLARAYGWERLPALPNWRNYYPGARFTEFAMTGGLDWTSAMLELYPPEALYTATPVQPPTSTPSITPVPSSTPLPTWTPPITGTPTLSPTPRPPTDTPTPSNTPLPTSTPPTIIPTFKP